MKKRPEVRGVVTIWRIVTIAGEEIAQGDFLTVSEAWRDLACAAGVHRLEYNIQTEIRGKICSAWERTSLLPATAVLEELDELEGRQQ